MDNLVYELQKRVLDEIDYTGENTDEEVQRLIEEVARGFFKSRQLSLMERNTIETSVFQSLRRLGAIQDLIDDPDVTEIMVNGSQHIFYEKGGQLFEWNKHFISEDKLEDVIQKIVGDHNRTVNLSNPIVDTRLKDGSRVNIVLSPISIDGHALTIRKFPENPMTMKQLVQIGSLPVDAAQFLERAVGAGYSILVAGGTGSGKTTFLRKH